MSPAVGSRRRHAVSALAWLLATWGTACGSDDPAAGSGEGRSGYLGHPRPCSGHFAHPRPAGAAEPRHAALR